MHKHSALTSVCFFNHGIIKPRRIQIEQNTPVTNHRILFQNPVQISHQLRTILDWSISYDILISTMTTIIRSSIIKCSGLCKCIINGTSIPYTSHIKINLILLIFLFFWPHHWPLSQLNTSRIVTGPPRGGKANYSIEKNRICMLIWITNICSKYKLLLTHTAFKKKRWLMEVKIICTCGWSDHHR